MHIVYLDPHPVPGADTEALQILYTVDALGQRGEQVSLVCASAAGSSVDVLGREVSTNVRFYPIAPKRWLPLKSNRPFYHTAYRLTEQLNPDIVFVRNLKMAEFFLERASGIPLVFETHEPFAMTYQEDHPHPALFERRKLRLLWKRERFVYEKASGLVAVPPLLADEVRCTYGIQTPSVTVPNGVDLDQATVLEQPSSQAQTGLEFLYLGSLHPWKGVSTLIEAMVHLRYPGQLHVAGGNAVRIDELRVMAERLGVANRVVFKGPVVPARRFALIHQADICLLPLTATGIGSRHTSPIKLFEYLAAGKPIIVSDLPSTRAIVENNKNALMVEVNNPIAMAAAIDRLIEQPQLRQQLGQAARQRANDFTWKNRAERLHSFFVQTLSASFQRATPEGAPTREVGLMDP